jgi:hypothetical protein
MYRSKKGRSPTGTWPLVSNPLDGFVDMEVIVPCGRCIFCRLERARGKTIRITHELQYWDVSSFLTLTYSDDNLTLSGAGIPTLTRGQSGDVTKFLKRLRKAIGKSLAIKYFQCGEYGDRTQRPHHHMILYGYDFLADRKLVAQKPALYQSPLLDRIWGKGNAVIGTVTWNSASYVASYCVKKLTGEMAKQQYDDLGRIPPYMTSSLGLGKSWIDEHYKSVYPRDSINVKGHLCRPPKYYDTCVAGIDSARFENTVRARQKLENDPQILDSAVAACLKKESELQIKKGSEF